MPQCTTVLHGYFPVTSCGNLELEIQHLHTHGGGGGGGDDDDDDCPIQSCLSCLSI